MNQPKFSVLISQFQTGLENIKKNLTGSSPLDNLDPQKGKKRSNARNSTRDGQRGTSRYIEKLMEQQRDGKLVKITYEEIGLFPRSFNRVFDRLLKQILSEDIAELALQEYRLYRYLFLTTIKCLVSIIVIPLVINFAAKNWVVGPLTEYFWNGTHQEIFLNMDQQKRAFSDLQNLEDEIYFETLTLEKEEASKYTGVPPIAPLVNSGTHVVTNPPLLNSGELRPQGNTSKVVSNETEVVGTYNDFLVTFKEELTKRTIEKTKHIYIEYNEESVHMVTNLISDLLSLLTLLYLLLVLDLELTVTKSFLFEMFFGLDDSRKSLIILLVTDLLVGYHSSNLWEVFFAFLFEHYGFNENHTAVYLLVATLPVLLDVLFKYLIFRHLNRTSPATVATYQALIE
uniref:Potassium/proton antiporter CemA n=1 Tax=Hafniomonas laevis TaxID=436124 RepID=A0A0S2LNU0_9CHLO|nr:chloroplast enveloppe membrane protein [Hafniomonas laevis]ALO63028.1 chloroplast enveloppe membrane protein [Hafniomonas laevis]